MPVWSEASESEIDLTGLPLKGAKSIFMQNNFMKRGLLWRDPPLFIKQGKGRYSTACPSQFNKQPIVLTDKEKGYIDEKDATYGTRSYDESITYGSGDTKHHYICPRFWCLNDENGKQRSITLKEINEGKCGGWNALIPRTAKKIPPGGRIYEFTDQRFHRERYQMKDTDNILVYKPMYPGFQEKAKHPNNLCIPCCFGRPTQLSQQAIKNGWSIEERDKKLVFKNSKGNEKDKNDVPKDIYDGKNDLDYMYKPVGDGPGGAGPTFERDKQGNILLDTIKGDPQIRELPGKTRIITNAECNQSKTAKLIKRQSNILNAKSIKMEETPAWELFPLKSGQLGYLPESVQKFFQYNQKPAKNDSSLRLKINKPVFLRKGSEKSKTQSFLSCIADIYNYVLASSAQRVKQISLIHTMDESIRFIKDIIINHLNLDNYVTFQNGTLVDIFFKDADDFDVDLKDYEHADLYQKLHEKNPSYLSKIINSLNNFKQYLNDDDVEINYEYLWDIICTPRKDGRLGGIFEKGLNLLILKSPDDDITNKIEIICPSNHYGNEYFNIHREILLIYTYDNYYEPIYKYTRKSDSNIYNVEKLLYLPNINAMAPQLARTLLFVRKKLVDDCKPLPSILQYQFKTNISLQKMIDELQKTKLYSIEHQVLNLNTKTIGLIISRSDKRSDTNIYIPCLPSAINEELPFILIDDPAIINNFKDTLFNLQNIYKLSREKIPCKPVMKIIENSIIIGIITETNQFIPVHPEPNDDQIISKGRDHNGLIIIENNTGVNNYMKADYDIMTSDKIDYDREEAVNNIRLESQLYNAFRNILRIIINSLENENTIKKSMINILDNITIPYYTKLEEIIKNIKTIMNPYVMFTDYKIPSHIAINKILKCINLDPEKCSKNNPPCVYIKKDGKCILQIPKKNLISNTSNNEEIYYGKLADELIRYNKIRMFIFNPQTFLTFQQMSYDLRKDEIILLEEILYGDYFDNIVPRQTNPFISNMNLFETAEPAESISYKDAFVLDKFLNTEAINNCVITKEENKKLLLGAYLKTNKLSSDFTLMEFKHNYSCSWEIVVFILNDYNIDVTIDGVKDFLLDKFKTLLEENADELKFILTREGKGFLVNSLQTDLMGTMTTTNYYITPFDMFLIFSHYKCPCVIISRSKIPPGIRKHISFLHLEDSKNIYVIFGGAWNIRNPDFKTRVPIYSILQRNDTIKLTPSYFGPGPFYKTIISNPITNFGDYYLYSKAKPIKIKLGKIKIKGQI